MPDIPSGDFVEIKHEDGIRYFLAYLGGIYSCTCQEWKSQQAPEIRRTCTHLRQYRGEAAEESRINPSGARKLAHQKNYEEHPRKRDGATSMEELALAFENELVLEVDRYAAPHVVFFRKHRNAYLELESYPDPEYELDPEDPGFPPEMYIRRVTFSQEEENAELAAMVDATFESLGWRPSP